MPQGLKAPQQASGPRCGTRRLGSKLLPPARGSFARVPTPAAAPHTPAGTPRCTVRRRCRAAAAAAPKGPAAPASMPAPPAAPALHPQDFLIPSTVNGPTSASCSRRFSGSRSASYALDTSWNFLADSASSCTHPRGAQRDLYTRGGAGLPGVLQPCLTAGAALPDHTAPLAAAWQLPLFATATRERVTLAGPHLVGVRVVLFSELVVCLFDLLVGCAARHAQHIVVVPRGRCARGGVRVWRRAREGFLCAARLGGYRQAWGCGWAGVVHCVQAERGQGAAGVPTRGQSPLSSHICNPALDKVPQSFDAA